MKYLKSSIILLLSSIILSCTSIRRPPTNNYITFLKKTLPTLPKGISKKEVEQQLDVLNRFNGVILSDGDNDAFKYNYYISQFKMTLIFSYKNSKKGKFSNYSIKRLKKEIF